MDIIDYQSFLASQGVAASSHTSAVASASGAIDLTALKQNNTRRVAVGLIGAATEDTTYELAAEHAAEPIKSMDDIYRISDYLIRNKRYRDNMLFIVGINFGLRVSDLRMLRFSNLINDNFAFRDSFPVFEKKTRNTRKKKKNRYITVNNAVIDAVTLFLEHTPNVCLSDYMFRSESNHGYNKNEPLNVRSIDRILKGIAADLNLSARVSTHTLRKTFCYWMMVRGGNDQRRLLLVQKMLNHSTPAQTLDYIGITADEINAAYKELNLGSAYTPCLVDGTIYEREAATV
jgi:integrase